MLKSIVCALAAICLCACAAPEQVNPDCSNVTQLSKEDNVLPPGWILKNLGNGRGVLAPIGNGGDDGFVMFAPDNGSWIFAVANLPDEVLGDAAGLVFVCDVMTNRPECVKAVIGENDEWGGAMRRMTTSKVTPEPYQWTRLSVALDRAVPKSFFSCGVGLEYKSAGAWIAVRNPTLSFGDAPAQAPEFASGDFDVPPEFGAVSKEEAVAVLNAMNKLAEVTPGMAESEEFGRDVSWLEAFTAGADTSSMRRFAEIKARWVVPDFSIAPAPAAAEFDQRTVIPDLNGREYVHTQPAGLEDGFLFLIRNEGKKAEGFTLKLNGEAADAVAMYRLLEVDENPDYPVPVPNGGVIDLGAGETAGIMIRAKSDVQKSVAGELLVSPFNPRYAEKAVPFRIDFVKLELPEQLPLKTFHWDYLSAVDPVKLELMLDGRVNTFHLAIWEKGVFYDFSKYIEAIRAVKAAAPELDAKFIVEIWFIRDGGGWKKEYEPWLDALVAAMEGEGLTYDDWYVEIYDEELSDVFLRSAKAMKEYNPKVKIFSDCINKEKGVIEKFQPYLDVWCPVAWEFPPYTSLYADELEQLRSLPSEYWIYACGPVPINPARRFREQPLLAAAYDMQGCCYWTAAYHIRPRGPIEPNDHYGFFYHNANGKPIVSRRWMEWQGGLNDFLVLDAARKSDDPEVARKAEELIAYAKDNLSAPNFWVEFTERRADLINLMKK